MNETQALAMLTALSQQMRLGIIRYLISRGEAGAPAGEIAREMGAIASRASFHLAALERAGLISAERRARQIIYRARNEELGALISFILNDCCKGHPDIRKCCGLP
ncbi:MAG: metalloregulator ArsR/SmtB family transcription factor [Pseudomonadota bacterium]